MSTRQILLISGLLGLVLLFQTTGRADELFSNINPKDGSTIKDPLTPISIEINTAVKADSIRLRINERTYQITDKELAWTPPRLVFTPSRPWSYGSYSIFLSFETDIYVTEKAYHFYSGSFFVDNQSALNKFLFSSSGTRLEKNLTSVWKMSKLKTSVEKPNIEEDEGYKNRYWESGYDISSWDNRIVSLNWLVDHPQNSGYGLAWYKKKVFIPKEYENKKVILTFEGVANQTHLWINGQSAGFQEKVIVQYLPSRFDITKLVRYGEENDLTVGCVSSLRDEPWPGGLSGIFGEVKLEFLPKIYVKQAYIDPSLADSSVKVRYEIENSESTGTKIDLSGIVEPTDADKMVSRGDKKGIFLEPGINNVELEIKIDNPKYWSPEEPYLYRLFSVVKEKGAVTEVTKDTFGFREFKAEGKYLYLNKNRFFIFGVYRSGYNWKDSAVRWGRLGLEPLEEARRTEEDFREGLKKRGVNLIRMWITPGRRIYDVTDRLGIISYECFECDLQNKKSKEYLDICASEIREWIKENYNHPSFVMLNFGNENWNNTEQPNYLYQRLKPEFKDRMIMCASSGMFGFPDQVKKKPDTDIIDMHSYTGNSIGIMGGSQTTPWTYMEDSLRETYEGYKQKVFGGEINIPVIVTEAPFQAWFTYWLGDGKRFLHEGKVTPESYLEIAKTPEGPNNFPIGWDLENASLRNRLGLVPEDISEKILKRNIESQRRLDILQGFGANTWGYPTLSLLYRPLFICSGVFDTNLFSGDKLNMKLYLLNHSPEKKTDLRVRVVVQDKDNKVVNEDRFNVEDIPSASRKIVDYAWKIPDIIKTALYDVKLYFYSNNTLASENYYEIYLLNKSDLRDSIVTTRKTTVLLLPQDQEGIKAITNILDSLKVPYDNLNIEKDLDVFYKKLKEHDILIVPPFYNDRINNWLELNPQMEVVGKSIRRWVEEEGGRVISFEQSIKGSLPWVREWRIMDGGKNCYIDTAVPEHPVYHNLVQHNFDTWNGKGGENTRYLITPLSENLIATVSANSNDAMAMAVAEAKVNNGSILASQVAATERYLKDSAATVYIQNLLAYVLEGKGLFPGVRDLKTQEEGNYFVDLNKCFYVNLKPYVNMGFMDEVAEDEKGGWSDQGENDLRHIPVGEDNPEKKYWQTVYHQELKDKQIFLGVPFEVIDPAKNVNKSCIVLSGGPRPYFPKEVKDIKIGKKAAKLYFLHSAVWCPGSGEVADYNIHYADGTKETIVLNGGKQIADWWGPKDLPEAKVAWSGKHPTTNQTVGVYLFAWNNSHPEKVIATIDFVSTQVAIPILLAITGEE